MAESSEWSTLLVSNVPLESTRNKLEEIFADFGPIKRCLVVPGKPGRKSTIGYVTFAVQDDCHAAMAAENLKLGDWTVKTKLAPDKKREKVAKEGEEGVVGVDATAASKKKARLIVRNLSFKATDKTLKEHFEKFGSVTEVNILKKPNGLMVGCAFVQFDKVNSAAKAIKEANAKEFIGRPVAVDWAVPKERFKEEQQIEPKVEIKEEEPDSKVDAKAEDGGSGEDAEASEEDEGSDEDDMDAQEDHVKEEMDDDNDEENDGDDVGDDGEEDNRFFKKPSHNLSAGHDIDEGKTVFIRNLSFQSCEEDLKDMMDENFGKVVFAKMVMDKVMGVPRGTGFVKFRDKDSADKCLEVADGEEGIYLDDRKLGISPALKKEDVEVRVKERKTKEEKDSRNLYLAREGLIREGTVAAEGVSEADMTKRKQVEKWKKNILKNLNMFISPNRLCVRNIPEHLDDAKLKTILSKNVRKGAKITECKIIRDLNKLGKNGVGASKEYGFVSFANHEDAMEALRSMNNNPGVFTKDKRPIIEFSIENKKAVNLRIKRMEKSREKNPNFKDRSSTFKDQRHIKGDKTLENRSDFSGSIADPKQKGLPTHSGPKVRHKKISRKALRKQEQDMKNPKKRKRAMEEREREAEKTQEPETKKRKKEKRNKPKKISKEQKKDLVEDKKFNALVKSYKHKLNAAPSITKKWFE